jgi:pimeloyl-ACP methyl ester carboxylesterase
VPPAEPQPPVIVLPGITATTLEDFYPIEPEEVWTAMLAKEYQRIALHPDDVRYEALEPARVMPSNPFGLVYGDLVQSLRHELSPRADRPTPVFGFGYDWRQDCTRTAEQLGEFVAEVLARTALLPHYKARRPTRVDIVGHSLGGLVIARHLALRQEGEERRVRRVVTMGSPFQGAIDAMQKLSIGLSLLTGPDPKAREREAARTIPSIYQLLPSYPEAIVFDPPSSTKSLFDVGTWQPSVLKTLAEFIRLRKATITAEELLRRYLATARSFIDAVNDLDPATALPEGAAGWLPIVGVDSETFVRARIGLARGRPWFEFDRPVNRYGADDEKEREQTGDGTVPFLGACPRFFERERLVCVTTDDLSFWELRDRLLAEFAGFHGLLPKVNHVQRLTARFLRDDLTWRLEARRAPGADPAKLKWPRWLSLR